MLKLRAKDADKVVLLHDVVGGFLPFLLLDDAPEAEAVAALDPREKRARIGWVRAAPSPSFAVWL